MDPEGSASPHFRSMPCEDPAYRTAYSTRSRFRSIRLAEAEHLLVSPGAYRRSDPLSYLTKAVASQAVVGKRPPHRRAKVTAGLAPQASHTPCGSKLVAPARFCLSFDRAAQADNTA